MLYLLQDAEELAKILDDLLVSNGVDIAVMGHVHSMERTYPLTTNAKSEYSAILIIIIFDIGFFELLFMLFSHRWVDALPNHQEHTSDWRLYILLFFDCRSPSYFIYNSMWKLLKSLWNSPRYQRGGRTGSPETHLPATRMERMESSYPRLWSFNRYKSLDSSIQPFMTMMIAFNNSSPINHSLSPLCSIFAATVEELTWEFVERDNGNIVDSFTLQNANNSSSKDWT